MRQGRRNGALAPRPGRAEIEPAALDLIQRHGSAIMGTARRYAASAEDAEDAYQRGLEILLTKAPSTRESDLVPWLKTVVKHEAFALRRQRERTPLSDDGELDSPAAAAATEEQAERYERLRLGAEALRQLKPQEIRCLLLRAEGLSYKEICEATGWTYTKVNRCLTEGRASFLARVAGIESGAECKRLAPLLSRLADGEAAASDMAALRPHLRSCLACRAALRHARAAPATVAALLPPLCLGAAATAPAGAARAWHTLVDWLQERALALGVKLNGGAQQLADLGTAQKVAAVAATAAIAGGGSAAVRNERPPHPERRTPVREATLERAQARLSDPPAPHPAPRPTPAPAPKPPASVREEDDAGEPAEVEPAAQEFEPSPAVPLPAEPPGGLESEGTRAATDGAEFGP